MSLRPVSRLRPVRAAAAGFTLVELVIVLAVVGAMAMLGLPALRVWAEAADLRRASGAVADVLLTSRTRAVVERRNYAVSVDYAADTCSVAPTGQVLRLSGSVDLYADASDPDCPPLAGQDILFRPNGTADASGYEGIYVRSKDAKVAVRYRVKVLGATARVGVERWQGGGWVALF